MSKSAKRLTRRQRIAAEQDVRFVQQAAAVAEYTEPKPSGVMSFQAKNANQKKALEYLESDMPVCLLHGCAGTGKSMIGAYRGAKLLRAKKIEKILLVRPAVGVGRTIGLLPGEISQKLAPYFAQTIAHLEKFLGKGYTKYCLDKGIIEMKAVEFLRGSDFSNCYVLCEESQNFTAEEFQMMLTRLSTGCQMVFTGDVAQHDLRGESGLMSTLKKIDYVLEHRPRWLTDEDIETMESGIGEVEFTSDDVLRSDITRAFVRMYHNI